MLSKGNQPNAEQKRWLHVLSQYPPVVPEPTDFFGDMSFKGCTLHHVVGRSGKQGRIDIGHWFVNRMPDVLHNVHSDHSLNVTHHRLAFTEAYGKERHLFLEKIVEMQMDGVLLPFGDDVIKAILSTNR